MHHSTFGADILDVSTQTTAAKECPFSLYANESGLAFAWWSLLRHAVRGEPVVERELFFPELLSPHHRNGTASLHANADTASVLRKNSFFPTQCTGIHSKSFLKKTFLAEKNTSVLILLRPPPPLSRNVPSLFLTSAKIALQIFLMYSARPDSRRETAAWGR